jgi:glutamate 5-kinase
MAGGAGSSIGSGGMLTKVLAAKRAARSGAHTVIAWGREDNVLVRLAGGEAIGTQLLAPTARLTARRQWMVDHLHTAGRAGAGCRRRAEADRRGQVAAADRRVAVRGEFGRGALITCVAEDGSRDRARPDQLHQRPKVGASCATPRARSKPSSATSRAGAGAPG